MKALAVLVATLAARRQAAGGAEAVAAVAAAVDQIARDVRLAGYDPRARGVVGLPAATAATLVAADRLQRWVGERAMRAVERLMGLVLTAVAVEMLLTGIGNAVAQFGK